MQNSLSTEPKLAHGLSSLRVLASLACVIICVAGLRSLVDFLAPVLIAFFIAVVSYPVVVLLRSWKFPRWLAIFVTLLVDAAVLTGFVFLTTSMLESFGKVWPEYELLIQTKLNELFVSLKEQEILTQEDIDALSWQENLKQNAGTVGTEVGNLLAATANFLGRTFFVLILMVFMLVEGPSFARKLKNLAARRGPNLSYLNRTATDVQRYLTIKTFVSAMTGLMAWGLCLLLKIDFAGLWGVLAFLLNYIPAIGSIVAAIPAVILALLTRDWVTATLLASGYFFINSLWGNFLEPLLMGRRFGISTLAVLLSVLFWGWMWGPVGMFLSVPLTMMVKVMLDNSREMAWMGELLSKEKKVPVLNEVLGESWVDGGEGEEDGAGSAEGMEVANLVRQSKAQDKIRLEPSTEL